jgi:hypothetical protein
LKDIASVVGQIQPQPAATQYPSGGLGSAVSSLIQPSQPSFTSYQSMQQQPVQQAPAATYEPPPQYAQPVASAYNPPQAHRQASPPPSSYYNQGFSSEQSFGNQSPYVKQEMSSSRGAYGAPPVARQSANAYSTEQVPSRVILIKNLPEVSI